MGKFILGILVGFVLVLIGAYFVFNTGRFPTSVYGAPLPFEKKWAMRNIHARADREAPKGGPFQATEADFTAGAQGYRDHCAVCHGLPNIAKTAIAKGEYPPPPPLWQGTGVTDDPPGETYWKLANGIRMTGMPGFGKTLPDKQLWQISFLLATERDKLPPSAIAILNRPPAVDNPGGAASQQVPANAPNTPQLDQPGQHKH
ncbi:MAG TPA: cytochrome c [Terriglobales bacterium]